MRSICSFQSETIKRQASLIRRSLSMQRKLNLTCLHLHQDTRQIRRSSRVCSRAQLQLMEKSQPLPWRWLFGKQGSSTSIIRVLWKSRYGSRRTLTLRTSDKRWRTCWLKTSLKPWNWRRGKLRMWLSRERSNASSSKSRATSWTRTFQCSSTSILKRESSGKS